MKVNFREEGNRLMVDVIINNRQKARDPHVTIRTQHVLDILKEKGYNVGEYVVEQENTCSTEGKNPTLSSTWILRKKEKVKNEKPATKSTKRARTPRSRTKTKENKLLGTKDLGGVQSQAQTDLSGQDKEISGE